MFSTLAGDREQIVSQTSRNRAPEKGAIFPKRWHLSVETAVTSKADNTKLGPAEDFDLRYLWLCCTIYSCLN